MTGSPEEMPQAKKKLQKAFQQAGIARINSIEKMAGDSQEMAELLRDSMDQAVDESRREIKTLERKLDKEVHHLTERLQASEERSRTQSKKMISDTEKAKELDLKVTKLRTDMQVISQKSLDTEKELEAYKAQASVETKS